MPDLLRLSCERLSVYVGTADGVDPRSRGSRHGAAAGAVGLCARPRKGVQVLIEPGGVCLTIYIYFFFRDSVGGAGVQVPSWREGKRGDVFCAVWAGASDGDWTSPTKIWVRA